MNFEKYLKSPDISRAYDVMFRKQVEYFRKISRELGINYENTETFLIKMASVSPKCTSTGYTIWTRTKIK